MRGGLVLPAPNSLIATAMVVNLRLSHIFRPHIENAIHEFLAADRKAEEVPTMMSKLEKQEAHGATSITS
ncbi:biorientation of chromosomes in cell division protein 1 isoform X1 [Arapaima gigas]